MNLSFFLDKLFSLCFGELAFKVFLPVFDMARTKKEGGCMRFLKKKIQNTLRGLFFVIFSLLATAQSPPPLDDTKKPDNSKSAGHFLRRAFGSDVASMEEVAQTINLVQRSGVEDYTRSLEELSKAGILLPKEGEEFLAKQLRFQQKLGVEGIDQASLVETGKVYSHFFKDIDKVKPEVVRETVWRAVRKTGSNRKGQVFANNPEDLFKSLPGARYTNRRYSLPGEEAVYTSLSRRTAIKEVKAGTKSLKLTNQQVENLFHIGSKDIEIDKVLDLTKSDTQKLFKLTKDDVATKITKDLKAYKSTQIIGHIAKRKGFKGIKAPSAPDDSGVNFISFQELR